MRIVEVWLRISGDKVLCLGQKILLKKPGTLHEILPVFQEQKEENAEVLRLETGDLY